MQTIALRFADNFAPLEGTIQLHEDIIKDQGSVWYGKLGARISDFMRCTILKNDVPRILLIHSGTAKRYWAYIDDISYDQPNTSEYPKYYGAKVERMNTWFHITKIEKAPNDVMSKCLVTSSNTPLSIASKHSMSPYFKITVEEG